MPPHKLYKTFRSFTHEGDRFSQESSDLILETPIEIMINGETHTLIMFTPGMARELVVGFLFTEGVINGISEIDECNISQVRRGDGEEVIEARVTISKGRSIPLATDRKRVSYSSCGICGNDNYYGLRDGLTRVKSKHRFSMEVLNGFVPRMQVYQPLYERTGGAHAAILLDYEGREIFHYEDMGRHNALDKVIGAALIAGIPSEDKILVSSGRASLEMILKTARAGFPVFVAMSRPTSRALEAAKFYNITLMDMAKDSNCIYTHARRIKGF
jgi:FdhD protein